MPASSRAFPKLLLLTLVVAGFVLALGIWPRSHAQAESNLPALKTTFDSVSVRTLRVVDEQGRPRFVIGAPLPNPKVNGKEFPRSSPVNGIQFLDTDGNEHGGVAIIDSVHGAALCFDYDTAEAMCMTKANQYKGIAVYDPPGKDVPVGATGSQRIELSLDSGQPHVVLSDSKGKDRIVLAIDANDKPTLQILDANGKTVYELPKADAR